MPARRRLRLTRNAAPALEKTVERSDRSGSVCYPKTMTCEHLKPWQPLSPEVVSQLFARAEFPWWIAGGHAIERFVGRTLREHGDTDVLLLRRDRAAARALLRDWDCWAADPPGRLRPWPVGEDLPISVSDVWCRADPSGPWQFQLMLDDSDGETWRSRRCGNVTKPVGELGWRDASGVPCLCPEVQLFYKAKAPRPKDEVDLAAALPMLSQQQRVWLAEAISKAYGPDNPWLIRLGTGRG